MYVGRDYVNYIHSTLLGRGAGGRPQSQKAFFYIAIAGLHPASKKWYSLVLVLTALFPKKSLLELYIDVTKS